MAWTTVQYNGFLVTVDEKDWPEFLKKVESQTKTTESSTEDALKQQEAIKEKE